MRGFGAGGLGGTAFALLVGVGFRGDLTTKDALERLRGVLWTEEGGDAGGVLWTGSRCGTSSHPSSDPDSKDDCMRWDRVDDLVVRV
jgi:hypothetical protein